MAIKGKRKPKGRTGRSAAAAPRPFLVRPKTPLFRRTGTQVVLVVLVEALIFGGLVLAGAASEDDAYRQRITQFGSLVDSALYSSGVAQPLPGSPLVLPELGQAVSGLQAGEVEAEQLKQSTETWVEAATTAADRIESVDARDLPLVEARNLMQNGLRLYSNLATEMSVAVDLEGEPRTQLVTAIVEDFQVAATVFDTGYQKLQEERRQAELPVGTGSQPGIPGVPGLP